MLSIRQRATCLGFPADFSVVGDFFGYASTPPWNLSPTQTGLPQSLSIRTQVERLGLTHFHLNAIRVGATDGLLSPRQEQEVDCAAQVARDIYATIGIGIGRFDRWWYIPMPTPYAEMDNADEDNELVGAYSCKNGGVDAYFVHAFNTGLAGVHPKGDSVVVELLHDFTEDFFMTGRALAHELGHRFNLDHVDDPANLMFPVLGAEFPNMTAQQAEEVAGQDVMHPGC